MDPAKGKQLIEASGWTQGSDGIYEKDGQKLSTVVAVRAGARTGRKWMQLVGDQVKRVRDRHPVQGDRLRRRS